MRAKGGSVSTESFVAKCSITINADAATVWNALTNPELIKQYLYGAEVISDWKEGSTITYKGIWQGRSYEDKGVIKKLILKKLLVSTMEFPLRTARFT